VRLDEENGMSIVNDPTTRPYATLVRIGGVLVCLLIAAVFATLSVRNFADGHYLSGALEAVIGLLAIRRLVQFAQGTAGAQLVAALAARRN
jgi:hypothetical protein